jgi:hypothetical protein
MSCPKSVLVLAVISTIILLAVLFLPTIFVVLLLPNAVPIVGAGSLWGWSKAVSILVLLLFAPLILLPCFFRHRRNWLFPLPVAILSAVTVIVLIIYTLFFEAGISFIFCGFLLLALAILTFLESFLAKRSMNRIDRTLEP